MIARFYYSHDRATRWRFLGAVALACAVVEYYLKLATVQNSIWLTRFAGYWLVAATCILFVVALVEELRAHWPGWAKLRPHWPGLLAGVLIALFWQVHEPHDFKILFDEHVLGGIARGMHYLREGAYPSSAHYINDHLVTSGYGVDKRPLMFPFLVSVVHDLSGFRPENSFVVNGLLGFLLLMLIYGVGAAMGGRRVGCFGQLLLASLPLLAQNATGGGFDLLNVTATTLFFLAAWNYWRQPGTGGLNLFVFTGLVLANCRYESMLYLGLLALLVILKWVRERHVSLTLPAALSPPLALPPLLLNVIFMSGGGGSYFQTTRENFLNVKYLGDNIAHAGYFLFMPSWWSNNSILFSAIGLVALLLALVWILRRLAIFTRENSVEVPLFVCLLGVLGVTFVGWLSFWGHWDEPPVERFSLPLYTGFAWCAMFMVARILRGRQLPAWVLGGTAIYAVVVAAPVSSEAYMTNEFQSYVTYHWVRDYVLAHTDRSTLIVSRAGVMFTLYGRANIHLGIANRQPEKVANVISSGLYREVWVVQELTRNMKLNAWVEYPPARLDQRILLQTITEKDTNINFHIRISRVVGFDSSRPPGVRRLASEMDPAKTEDEKKRLGGDYAPPSGTESVLTERPAGEPPAYPTLTETPTDEGEFNNYLLHQYPW